MRERAFKQGGRILSCALCSLISSRCSLLLLLIARTSARVVSNWDGDRAKRRGPPASIDRWVVDCLLLHGCLVGCCLLLLAPQPDGTTPTSATAQLASASRMNPPRPDQTALTSPPHFDRTQAPKQAQQRVDRQPKAAADFQVAARHPVAPPSSSFNACCTIHPDLARWGGPSSHKGGAASLQAGAGGGKGGCTRAAAAVAGRLLLGMWFVWGSIEWALSACL